jgi:hypothetical protein
VVEIPEEKMTYTMKSATTERKHELIRLLENNEISKEQYDSEMSAILVKEKQEIQDAINKVNDKVIDTQSKVEALPRKVEKKTLRQLYKDTIDLYREAEQVFLTSRKLKKEVREMRV